ncbi:Protease HtpX [Sinobacterium norvegicum]|uniref:Protease HtpX n=1 Tax=Sinobacterium norvegicum TaxID=1641715 RepID=A0ABN8EJ04_9GAMM|nr:M48 family metallopeptidase [Sinobacterium norvegicum]CAH0991332.1 Protease HtpX [Sinobacterium norvegicum]
MDFFSQQDQARRQTGRLVLLFLVAVTCLIVLTNIGVALIFGMLLGQTQGSVSVIDYINWQSFGKISLLVVGVIACAIVYKWLQLGSGGKAVAESLGGQRVAPNSDNHGHQQLLNVVEEMALAANMPVPAVYLLADEPGVNAFAAGNTPADAVIGITDGALQLFDRDQLQGVIAHEFSHILNGDMRLNIRLIALLHGILFIGMIGESMVYGRYRRHRRGYHSRRHYHSSSRSDSDNKGAQIGLLFIVIGWLGRFFGGMIKAAVSRQREFLADASAVQFTRNPDGIADALKIIAGHGQGASVDSPNAEQASHLFFGQALARARGMFATHPPLDQRIQQIQPDWDGQYLRPKPAVEQPDAVAPPSADPLATVVGAATAASVLSSVSAASTAAHDTVEGQRESTELASLRRQLSEPFGACALVFALLLDSEQVLQQRQLKIITDTGMQGLSLQSLQFKQWLDETADVQRLALIDRAMPALKCLSENQYRAFNKAMLLMIRSDGEYTLLEWCLFQLVSHYMAGEFSRPRQSRPRYKKVNEVAEEYTVLLSALAHFGRDKVNGDEGNDQSGDEAVEAAFQRGANTAGLYNIELQPLASFSMEGFIKAANRLVNCYPLLKPRLIKGMKACALNDGIITAPEQELIAAIAAMLDCPTAALQLDDSMPS